MKKVANIILALIVVLLFTNSASFAVEPQIDLYINDVNVKPDSSPYISDTNRTMVPISFVANGFNFQVKWNASVREVVINNNGKEAKLYIDSKYALVNGVKTEIDPGKSTAVTIKNGRTMVPVSFVANTFDLEVGWVAYPRGGGIVKFYSKEYVKPYTPPVVPPTNNYPVAPGNQTFIEGKALDPSIIPGARQTIGNNRTKPVIMTDAKEAKIREDLTIYPHTLIQATDENGNKGIYMKASGGGAADIFYYKDGKKVGSLMTGDTHDGWMLVASPDEMGKFDYMIVYGTEDKMVPAYEVSATYNKNIRDVD